MIKWSFHWDRYFDEEYQQFQKSKKMQRKELWVVNLEKNALMHCRISYALFFVIFQFSSRKKVIFITTYPELGLWLQIKYLPVVDETKIDIYAKPKYHPNLPWMILWFKWYPFLGITGILHQDNNIKHNSVLWRGVYLEIKLKYSVFF